MDSNSVHQLQWYPKLVLQRLTKEINLAIEMIRLAWKDEERGLLTKNLNKHNLKIVARSNSSFANCRNLWTQIGYNVLFKDESNQVSCLSILSYTCICLFPSVRREEVYAFADYFQNCVHVEIWSRICDKTEDSLDKVYWLWQAFRVMPRSSKNTEKRFMIDVKATRRAVGRDEIDNTERIRPSDTKAERCQASKEVFWFWEYSYKGGKRVNKSCQWWLNKSWFLLLERKECQ